MNKIKLNQPHEILAFAPYALGYKPRQSVVLIAMRGAGGLPGGPSARIDATIVPTGLFDVVLDFIETFDVEDLYIAWYGDDLEQMLSDADSIDILDMAGLAAQQCIDARNGGQGFVSVGLTDFTQWISGIDARQSRVDTFEELCEAGYIGSFEELNSSPAVAEAVYAGSAPVEDGPTFPRSRAPWSERQEAVAAARKWRSRKGRRGVGLWQAAIDALQEGTDPYEAAGNAENMGKLNAALDQILLRDRLILFGVDESMVRLTSVSASQLVRRLAQAHVAPPDRVTALISLLEHVGDYSDDDDAAAYAVAAYLAWWADDRERAISNAQMAINSNRHYPLAKLVLHALFVNLPSPAEDEESARAWMAD
ncbi:DUF4192 family protein [Trueperella pecoris]|uniref:DUF4192 family protein n=1 Tax=Trueperella pecoris TaxID=2733571 RepID=A0A7M1R322_9ACTO|nr:DUF4192 family protein [Trueperella pecoris]QOR48521.1 DUF4192 family protein [Trueperella pecoris]